MLQSLLHAREWVTLPATLYAIHKLVVDVSEKDLLQNVDWIILPIANPDGYEHTHTSVSKLSSSKKHIKVMFLSLRNVKHKRNASKMLTYLALTNVI